MTILLAVALAATIAAADARQLTLSSPVTVATIDTDTLDGEPARLAWAPDGTRLYLLTAEREVTGALSNVRHHLVELDRGTLERVGTEPDWVAPYWTWKSAQSAPGLPAFRIEVEEEMRRITSTSIPRGGDLARGGTTTASGTTLNEGIDAGMVFHTAHVYVLRLKGEVVGEFINAVAVPGLTFGWGPAGSRLVAYADRDGRLVVMDDQGRKQEIKDEKDVRLPAWSEDGTRLAYVQKTGRSTFDVRMMTVTGGRP